METALLDLLKVERGHFAYESGYHGEIWLDLDRLLSQPHRLTPLIDELATRLAQSEIDAVVGPLAGGAFIAQGVAAKLATFFAYTEPQPPSSSQALYSVAYRLPATIAPLLKGRRVAIVDDVVNAGSALRGTFHALVEAGAKPVVAGALLVLGDAADPFVKDHGMAFARLAALENPLWSPAGCPLCARGAPFGRFQSRPY
jgi:orotate phosphoribosyltransferase